MTFTSSGDHASDRGPHVPTTAKQAEKHAVVATIANAERPEIHGAPHRRAVAGATTVLNVTLS